MFLETWARAASKPRPASTQMVSRSIESGSAVRISVWRRWTALVRTMFGSQYPTRLMTRKPEHAQGPGEAEDAEEQEAEDHPADQAGHLGDQHPVGVPAERAAGHDQLAPDGVPGPGRGEATREAEGGVVEGLDQALAGRAGQLAVAQVGRAQLDRADRLERPVGLAALGHDRLDRVGDREHGQEHGGGADGEERSRHGDQTLISVIFRSQSTPRIISTPAPAIIMTPILVV